MPAATNLQIRAKGALTLPVEMRRKKCAARNAPQEMRRKKCAARNAPQEMRRKKCAARNAPQEMRRKYGLDEGAIVTLIDLGDGSFLLTPVVTQVDKLGDRVARAIREADVSEEELLVALDEERELYYRQRYVGD